jgi:hypothetical protein
VVFEGLKAFPLVKAWYARCMDRQASKNAICVCDFVMET